MKVREYIKENNIPKYNEYEEWSEYEEVLYTINDCKNYIKAIDDFYENYDYYFEECDDEE